MIRDVCSRISKCEKKTKLSIEIKFEHEETVSDPEIVKRL